MRKRLRKKKDKQEVVKMVNEDSHIPCLIDLLDEFGIVKVIPRTCIGAHEDITSTALKTYAYIKGASTGPTYI
jgi:hypothetical protein